MECLGSYLGRLFAGKPVVASQNVGCVLRLLVCKLCLFLRRTYVNHLTVLFHKPCYDFSNTKQTRSCGCLRSITANPGLNFNSLSCFFCWKAFFPLILTSSFKHQNLSGSESQTEFHLLFIHFLVPQCGKFLFLKSTGIQVYLSRFPLTIGIRNPSKNPSSTDNESGVHYLESEIYSVEYRIQECLGLS